MKYSANILKNLYLIYIKVIKIRNELMNNYKRLSIKKR